MNTLVSYQYDGASRLLGRILSNGAKTAYGWDDDDRLTSLTSTSANGAIVSNITYTVPSICPPSIFEFPHLKIPPLLTAP